MFVPNLLKKGEYSMAEVELPEIDETENKKLKNIFTPVKYYKKMTRTNTQNPIGLITALQSLLKRELKNKDFNPESEEFKQMLVTIIAKNPIRQLVDPKAPKKPKSAYMFFTEKQRKSHSEPGPQLFTILAEEWKGLKAEEKKPYEKLAKKDKERYEAEKQKYVTPSVEELMKLEENTKVKAMGVNSTKKTRDPNEPRKPKGTYMYFCADKRDEVKERLEKVESEISIGTRVKTELKNMWAGMTDAQKAKYKNMYNTANEEYKTQLAAYQAKNTTKTVPQKKTTKPKKPKAEAKSDSKVEAVPEVSENEEEAPAPVATKPKAKPKAKTETKTEAKVEPAKPAGKKAAVPVKGKKPAPPKPAVVDEDEEETPEKDDDDDLFNDEDD